MRMLAVLVALVLSAAPSLAQPYPNKQVASWSASRPAARAM